MPSFPRLATLACAVALAVPARTFVSTNPPAVTLQDPASREGYVAMLLINEVPFPGEGHYVSVADSKAGMLQILWVLHHRLIPPPRGYTQRQIAMVTTKDIIDIITAGGVRGQVDGFYRAEDGTPTTTARVQERLAYLTRVANKGAPGKFADLIGYAKRLGEAYFSTGPDGANLFAELREIDGVKVTGSAYSWMTDEARFSPGGNYVRIPDANRGGLGGNRFFTLRELR
jgi:hypothetical protein